MVSGRAILALAAAWAVSTMPSAVAAPNPTQPALLTYEVSRLGSGAAPEWHYGHCLVRPDGSGAVQVMPLLRNGQRGLSFGRAAWSPNGKAVAVFRGSYLVVADARGHVVRTLYSWVKRSGYGDSDPAWSPDGRWIAVVTNRGTAIMVVPARGKGRSKVVAQAAFGSEFVESPSWTPNSARLVFAAYWAKAAGPGVYSVGRDGKSLRQILVGAQYRQPALSPDGSRLAYVFSSGSGSYIAVADADGSHARPLAPPYQPGVTDPAWSPSRGDVAYWRAPDQQSDGGGGIIVAHADGSGERVVVPSRADYKPSQPSWRKAVALPPAHRASCT